MNDFLIPALAAILTGGAVYALSRRNLQKSLEQHAQKNARELESAKLSLREEAIVQRETMEAEYRERLGSLNRTEERLVAKEEAVELRRQTLDQRETELHLRTSEVTQRLAEAESAKAQAEAELQRIGNLDKAKARDLYLKKIQAEFRDEALDRAKKAEQQVVADTERAAKKAVLDVIQRHVVDYVTEATLAVVELPSEDMKGRIIGREGRNIRAFEQVTGVDLIVDETPEAVVISSFDPVRRETARITLMNMMLDGRIHPGRIEELHERATQEVARTLREAGERAADRAEVAGLSPAIIDMMGRLRFRTSFAQNVLDHSVEVARLAAGLAHELGLNAEVACRAGFLHDIGKALGPEFDGPHALTGMEYLKGFQERESILIAVGAHHQDIEPSTPEAVLVIIADTISASRPGARRESLENHIKRLTALEAIANSFAGVERSYAVQAGREIRLIVKPDKIDDLAAKRVANQVARRIEKELEYAGQIKVTVIRETRAQDIAK